MADAAHEYGEANGCDHYEADNRPKDADDSFVTAIGVFEAVQLNDIVEYILDAGECGLALYYIVVGAVLHTIYSHIYFILAGEHDDFRFGTQFFYFLQHLHAILGVWQVRAKMKIEYHDGGFEAHIAYGVFAVLVSFELVLEERPDVVFEHLVLDGLIIYQENILRALFYCHKKVFNCGEK